MRAEVLMSESTVAVSRWNDGKCDELPGSKGYCCRAPFVWSCSEFRGVGIPRNFPVIG